MALVFFCCLSIFMSLLGKGAAQTAADDSIDRKSCHTEIKSKQPGAYIPQCKEDGTYEERQCHGATGFCWCVEPNSGEKIEGTSRRPTESYVDCAAVNRPKRSLVNSNCQFERGFCVLANGAKQDSGVIKLNSNDGNSFVAQQTCLELCQNRKGATGCEVIWDQGNRGCYVHTQTIAKGNNAEKHSCWVFSKCTASTTGLSADVTKDGLNVCTFGSGDGRGGTEFKLPLVEGRDNCIKECLKKREDDDSINGATVFKQQDKKGCWCEQGMSSVVTSNKYDTCKFNLKESTELCKFQQGDGRGGSEIRIGSIPQEYCIQVCLNRKEVDDKINGVTVYKDNSAGCWCEKGMKYRTGAGTSKYKTCFLRTENYTFKPVSAEKLYAAIPKRTQDYVNFTIRVNDIFGHSMNRLFGAAYTCPGGKGITGFRIKRHVISSSDTRITGIEMICQDGSKFVQESRYKKNGVWGSWSYCDSQETKDTSNFVVGFRYRSVKGRGMSQLQMKCSNRQKEMSQAGDWVGDQEIGTYSGCSTTERFCGYAAEEGHREIGRVKFLCCSKPADKLLGQGEWKPLGRDICIGGKNENYGFFRMPYSGFLMGMRFEYIDGSLNCKEDNPTYLSRFGCNYQGAKGAFSIYVTTLGKGVILPVINKKNVGNPKNYYYVIGRDAKKADNFTLSAVNPYYLKEDDEVQIWYGEDLNNQRDRDNGGTVCVNVFGKMIKT